MNIIKNFEKYQGNSIFTSMFGKKIKLVKGNKEKILDLYIPTIVLFELDEHYFKCMTSDKWMKEEYITYGIDDKLESFEGFEAFIKDYCMYKKDIELKSNKLELEKYTTALRFNKGDIYKDGRWLSFQIFLETHY